MTQQNPVETCRNDMKKRELPNCSLMGLNMVRSCAGRSGPSTGLEDLTYHWFLGDIAQLEHCTSCHLYLHSQILKLYANHFYFCELSFLGLHEKLLLFQIESYIFLLKSNHSVCPHMLVYTFILVILRLRHLNVRDILTCGS